MATAKKPAAKKAASTKKPAAKKAASTKKPAAKKAATTKKPAAKKPAAKKPAAKKPATAKKPEAAAAPRAVPKVSPVKGKTIDWYASTLAPWQKELVEQIGALVAEAAPKASGSIKWAQPVWEHGGPFLWTKAHKNHVSVGFWRGADLDDKEGVLEGDGSGMRHVKIKAGGALPKVLGALVRQAADLNEKHGDPTKKG